MAPAEGRPVTTCACGAEVGVVVIDEGTVSERELLVDLEPHAMTLDSTNPVWVWVRTFSGHPPRGEVLPQGNLHHVHRCRSGSAR